MVLDPEIVSFPHQLEPLDSEERRVTWALVLLAIGSIAIAIWYRRRVGS